MISGKGGHDSYKEEALVPLSRRLRGDESTDRAAAACRATTGAQGPAQRRLLMLAPMRARVEAGESPDAVLTSLGKSLFWKDKPLVAKLLTRWDAAGVAKVAERAGKLERELMLGEAPPRESIGEELVAIARVSRRR